MDFFCKTGFFRPHPAARGIDDHNARPAATFDGEVSVQIASNERGLQRGIPSRSGSTTVRSARPAQWLRRRAVSRTRQHLGDAGSGLKRASVSAPHRHLRLRHLARRFVFGHLDAQRI